MLKSLYYRCWCGFLFHLLFFDLQNTVPSCYINTLSSGRKSGKLHCPPASILPFVVALAELVADDGWLRRVDKEFQLDGRIYCPSRRQGASNDLSKISIRAGLSVSPENMGSNLHHAIQVATSTLSLPLDAAPTIGEIFLGVLVSAFCDQNIGGF